MDEATRRELHEELDRIIGERLTIEGDTPHPDNALAVVATDLLRQDPVARIRCQDLFEQSVRLSEKLLGQSIRKAALAPVYSNNDEQRQILRRWLVSLVSLLYVPPSAFTALTGKRELTVFDVLDALSALDAGEIRPLFVANKGKNRRANRWTLARAKLEALVWKQRLVCGLGYEEKAANYEITVAFGEQWDTIRKWRAQCESILGRHVVEYAISAAGGAGDPFIHASGMLPSAEHDPLKLLERSGQTYRSELTRGAQLSKRKAATADG